MNQDEVREIAREAAKEAIAELRKTQKRGRSDTAGGSKVIGDITRRYRGEDGYLVGIAAEAGVHPTTLGKIESGQRGMSLVTFAKLAKVLGSDYVKDVLKALAP